VGIGRQRPARQQPTPTATRSPAPGTFDGINVAAAATGQLEIIANMFGPSAANTGGWGNLLGAQRYAIFLAATF
jgi:hypothetical protein